MNSIYLWLSPPHDIAAESPHKPLFKMEFFESVNNDVERNDVERSDVERQFMHAAV